jgi:arsenical pump membrane protein
VVAVTGSPEEVLALGALAAVLVTAVVAPRWQTPTAAAGAALVVATGAASPAQAGAELRQLAPVVAFLVAVLVLAGGCAAEGLFDAAGAAVGRFSRGSGKRLLAGSFAVAAGATVALSLDTTVVLVTPVVVAAARRRSLPAAPPAYAAAHLANSASLLLPVSNLTNLLALAVVPIGFGRFAALMALPWVVMLGVEGGGIRWIFRRDLVGDPPAETTEPAGTERIRWPRVATLVVALTLAGFAAASSVGVAVAWPAGAGALVLSAWALFHRRTTVGMLARSGQLPFAIFVLALGVVVRGAADRGLARALSDMLPHGSSLPALLGIAAVAAVAANVMNNLPATLVLLPLLAGAGVGPVMAALIGVDVGPNLGYPGSLATLLWRRQVGSLATLRRWTVLGVITVPVGIALSTVALWIALRL